MVNRDYLEEIIKVNFPDLVNTNFSYNNAITSSFTEQSLLPFLIYQNTIDAYHRLIGLYLPENSGLSNLIPVYVMMGQYRKVLDKAMAKFHYRNQNFKDGEKQVVLNGTICSITGVNYFNRQLTVKSGMGNLTDIPFSDRHSINWIYKNASDIRDQINQFDKKDKASNSNIFTFPLAPDDKHYEGVIIFTNTSKFENLLRNIKVSGADLRDYINIKKVVFPINEDEIRFVSLSKPKTDRKPVSLLIARHDAFRSYDAIIDADAANLNHIKTIIIDDFDELVNRWEKSDKHKEEITWLNDNYFQKLRNRQIQDLYLVCRNSNIHVHDIFSKAGIDYYPWLLKPLEEATVNKQNDLNNDPSITVALTEDTRFESLNNQLNTLIDRWKMLAQDSFCNGEILKPINCLYDLRKKLNSYFNPETLKEGVESFLATTRQLQIKWFASGQDYYLIEETRKFGETCIKQSSGFSNFKLQFIQDELKRRNVDGMINIISDNSFFDDEKWLSEYIQSIFPTVNVICLHKKDFYVLHQNNQEIPRVIFYLTSDKKILGAAAGNILSENQVFILNKSAFSFTQNYLRKYQRLQVEAGDEKLKYELLNISIPPKSKASDPSGLIPIQYSRLEAGLLLKEEEIQPQEVEMQDVVMEIINKNLQKVFRGNSENYILFFEDGTLTETLSSRHFFLYEDDKEYNDVEKILRTVIELKAGDQIIIANRGLPVRDLMEQALEKDSEYAYAMEMDEKWRLLLKNYIKRSRIDLDYLCRRLSEHGFDIGPAAVRNWIDNNTRRPDRFKSLLQAFSKLGIINKDEIKVFDNLNASLKSMQIKFIRTAISGLIARLQGINFSDSGIFNDDLLNDFINHIEIKRISSIHKI